MNNKITKVIGLTGQTGAGKSILSRMFADRDIEIIDADKIARETIETSNDCLMELVLAFSTEVIRPDATLNREKLASICFGDKQKLKKLNDITFPYIIRAIVCKLEEAAERGEPMVVIDAPTLYESGLDKRCDRVVAVLADVQVRTQRIMARDNMTEAAAQQRVEAQNKDAFYAERADDILKNDGDMDALRLAFLELFEKLVHGEQKAAGDMQSPEPEVTDGDDTGDAGDFEELTSENE